MCSYKIPSEEFYMILMFFEILFLNNLATTWRMDQQVKNLCLEAE